MDRKRNKIINLCNPRRCIGSVIILILLTIPAYTQIKKADLAGQWYSAGETELRTELNSYLEKATPPEVKGEIVGLISPHAGFIYSGPVAAYGFKAIREQNINTVIVIGFSHRMNYDGIALLDEDGFETPLGVVKINREITEELIKNSRKIFNYPVAFSGENSVEMEVPFLQMVLKDFRIVLIAIGDQSFENSQILGEALYEVLKDKEKFLLVASTDMSHYLPYEEANRVDKKTISVIEKFDPDALYTESLFQNHRLMCGYGAVCATMIAAEKLRANKVEILKYANSGDTAGDKKSVVGYLSAAMVKSQITNPKSQTDSTRISTAVGSASQRRSETNSKFQIPNSKQGENNMLNQEQRKKMLKLARDSIINYLKHGKKLQVKEDDTVLNREMGAFVTLHEHGQLRGCIGNLIGRGPFYLTVRDMAIEAATGDPRFRPVTLKEMDEIDIEISALSPLEKIDDPEKIIMGKHGVLVRSGFTSGVYLPQVATETGWTKEEFMNSLCGQKAGMRSDAWKKGECEIYIFTAEVFGEKEDKD